MKFIFMFRKTDTNKEICNVWVGSKTYSSVTMKIKHRLWLRVEVLLHVRGARKDPMHKVTFESHFKGKE